MIDVQCSLLRPSSQLDDESRAELAEPQEMLKGELWMIKCVSRGMDPS